MVFVKLGINNHIVGLVHKNHIIRTHLMYHAACKVEFQPFTVVLTADVFQLFTKLFNNDGSIRSGQNNRRQLALSSAIPVSYTHLRAPRD